MLNSFGHRASDISSDRGAAKFTKTPKMPRNSVEILSNTCLYNIFETYFSYWGYLIAVNLQIYLRTSSLKRANNVPRLPRVDYVAKNWALAMMLKALPLVHFWRALLLKTLKTIAKFALEISTKSAVFYRLLFGEFCPGKSADFSANCSLKILRNLTFSSATCQKPCLEATVRNQSQFSGMF